MRRDTFESMLGKILAMFARNPSQAMNGVCWDVCAELPDVFADYAVDQARDLDKMPGNLSKFLRDSWFHWREAHPSMAAREQSFGCDFCNGGMIHYVQHRDGSGWLPMVALCGHCRPTGQTHGNIRRFGGEIVHPADAYRICAEKNGRGEKPQPGQDFTSRLQDWKRGQRPDERAPIPVDDRPDRAEGWQ